MPQYDQSLLQVQSELTAVVNAIGDGLLVLDLEDTVLLHNDAAVQVLSYPIYDFYQKTGKLSFTNRPLTDLLILKNQEGKKVSPANEVLKSGLPIVRDDLYFETPSGGITRLYTNLTPILDEKEKIVRVIILFRDITQEKQLQERQEEFISVISHELRTPVAVIEGTLSTMLQPKIVKLDPVGEKFVRRAYSSILYLAKLVQDLTTLRKLDQEKGPNVDLDTFYLTEVVREVTESLRERAAEKGLSLAYEAPKTALPKITTSRERITEALINLIDNGIKYTDKGGVTVALTAQDGKALITIRDTGAGIPREARKKVFTRFFRGEEWKTRKTSGTGLGLYICRRIVEGLGGRIWFESEEGKGTTFYVELPLVPRGAGSRAASR